MAGFFEDAARRVSDQADPMLAGLKAAGHQGIHNFSVGVLDTYFKLLRLADGNVDWDGQILCISGLPGGRRKVFIFGDRPISDAKQLAELQAGCALYSQHKYLDLPKRGTFKEVCYDLSKVLDPASYPTAKKRYQRLVYPGKHLERLGVTSRALVASDLPAVKALHDDWVKFKMDDLRTMRMLFPKARYYECLRLAIDDPSSFYAQGSWYKNRLISCRALYVEKETAFDLAFFSATWLGLSNLVESLSMQHMQQLASQGIATINCGAGLHKNLHAYKAHWPCYDKVSYIYSKL